MTETIFQVAINEFCYYFQASETSGHRTEARNKEVGGAPRSHHLGWKCRDVVLDDWTRKHEAIDWLRAKGLYVFDETKTKNHLHVDDRHNAFSFPDASGTPTPA